MSGVSEGLTKLLDVLFVPQRPPKPVLVIGATVNAVFLFTFLETAAAWLFPGFLIPPLLLIPLIYLVMVLVQFLIALFIINALGFDASAILIVGVLASWPIAGIGQTATFLDPENGQLMLTLAVFPAVSIWIWLAAWLASGDVNQRFFEFLGSDDKEPNA